MDKQTPLQKIQAMPLPAELRQQALDLAATLPEEEGQRLFAALQELVLEFDEAMLGMKEEILHGYLETLDQYKKEVRHLAKEEEGAEKAHTLREAETHLDQHM